MKHQVLWLLNLLVIISTTSVFSQDWVNDFEEAKNQAVQKNKNIVLVFTGSDWCPPCIRLQKNILDQENFKEFATDNFVWVRADFPKRKANQLSPEQNSKNDELAAAYNSRKRFPQMITVDKEGTVLSSKTGYKKKMTVNDYINWLKPFAL